MTTSNEWVEMLNALSPGEKLVGGGGLLMFAASFFKWATISDYAFASNADVQRAAKALGAAGNCWNDPGAAWSILAVLAAAGLAPSIAARLANGRCRTAPIALLGTRVRRRRRGRRGADAAKGLCG